MDVSQWVMGGSALLLWTAATWAAAAWWYGRKLRLAAGKIGKLNKSRQFAAEQASKARDQLQTVHRENAELRQQLVQAGLAAERHRRAATGTEEDAPASPIIGLDLHAPMAAQDDFDKTIAVERRPD